jgi:small ligand-binding sensory domain FIST
LLNEQVVYTGGVGVLLTGPIGLRCVVSQGCRPIGKPLVVTRGQDQIIQELSGQTPLEYLRHLYRELPPQDQWLFERGLHIGLVMDEYRDTFRQGDFLVRNLHGLDRESGALVILDRIRVGQTVQFHVRDAASADEDLRRMLQADREAHPLPVRGGLLFTCNGRGRSMFEAAHHDARAIRSEVGAIPLAGFFAAGELGPLGKRNYIHGFTACVGLFE